MNNAKHVHILPSLPSASTNNAQAERLRGVLRRALQDAMAVGLGIGLGLGAAGCSSGSELDISGGGGMTGIGGGGGAGGSAGAGGAPPKEQTICERSARDLGCDPRQVVPDFARFAPSERVDYWAIGRGRTIWQEYGLSCAHMPDPAGCQTLVASAIEATVNAGNVTAANLDGYRGESFFLARGEKGIFIMKSKQELAAFLAPIDNVAEATAVAQYFDGLNMDMCTDKRAGITCESDAFVVVANHSECGKEQWLKVKVPHSGAAPTTEVIEETHNMCSIGRVPDGCEASHQNSKQWLTIADFWSQCAGLEAASVPAFYLLAEDLRAVGAPAALIEAAIKSAEDEMRHAAEVFYLAVQAGGQSQEVRVPSRAPKSLFDMAHENAVEGCVRETFGAFVAAYQAQAATNPEARSVLVKIAEDELRHAALSHEIAAWAEPQLSDEQRLQIEFDRRQLITQLRRSVDTNHAAEIYSEAGYPGAEAATRMLDTLAASLWSQIA
jgi:hypothetical protein